MATFIQSGDPEREKTPPRPREDLRRRPQRAATATELRATLAELGIAQGHAARLFSVSPRHIRRWRSGDRRLPHGVGIVLRLLATEAVTLDQVEQAALPAPAQANGDAEFEEVQQREGAVDQAGQSRLGLAPTFRETDVAVDRKDRDRAVPEPAPAPRPPALTTAAAQVLALAPSACRWPCGDPGHPDFYFCGAPVAKRPYCEHHYILAHMPPPTGGGHGARIRPVAQGGRQWSASSALPKGAHHVPALVIVPPAGAANCRSVR